MTASTQFRASFERDLAATAALAAYSLAVAAGFARVFSGWSFFGDLLLIVLLGHGTSFALRRLRVSGWIATPAIIVLLLWVLIATHYGETLRWLMPTEATSDQIDLEVGLVRDQFQTAVAPVLYGAGWATLAGFAMIIVVVMADAFAFRAEARGEALVPGGVLFVFIAALGSSRLRIAVTVALIAAGVIAVVALRAMHDRSRHVELTSVRGPGSMMVPAALGTAAAVAVLAGVVGPRIPGAEAEPLYNTRGRGGGVTEVISPLVDIRSRLTNRGNVELFRVNADAAAYWRVTTLPEFDGRTFRLPTRTLERVEGTFGAEVDDSRRIRQQIQILALRGQLVPAAADPFQAEGASSGQPVELRLNRDTNTLVTPDDLTAGDLFTVVSATPSLGPDGLRQATTDAPPDPIFVELPDDLPSIVTELAAEVTRGTDNPYDAALALQNWFRSDFEYSLEVQSGHGSNAIESFLNERIGYCEQFSATFAAMARTMGMPTRVAVGFTPGILTDGWYSVLGKNAHAWPEVWFDGVGWVAFEPTPGRGAPGAEAYTNVPAQQDETPADGVGGGGGGGGDEVVVNPTTPSTVVPPPTTIGDPSTGTTLPGADGPTRLPDGGVTAPITGDGSGTTGDDPDEDSGLPWRPIIVVTVILVVLAGPAAVRRWRSRSARGHGAAERVQSAWTRARVAAERAGVVGRPSMTAHEWAAATAAELPVAARPMRSLADIVDRVGFAPPGSVDLDRQGAFGSTLGHDCELWSQQVDRIAADTLSPIQRVQHYFTDLR